MRRARGREQYEAEELEYLEAESDRLLYVAATRVQELLVIGRHAGKPGKSWGEFDAHLKDVPELPVPASVAVPAPDVVDLSEAVASTAAVSTAKAHSAARTASWAAVSVTAEAKFSLVGRGFSPGDLAGGPAASDADDPSDPTRVVTADTPSRRADAGVAWGTLVHGLLEHAMRHRHATRADLRRLALWLTMEEPQLRGVIEEALDTVESAAGADFWQTARAASECHEEVPFSVREDRGGVTTVMSGTIDLAYRADDGWRILDYKTDAGVSAEELEQRYRQQLEAYRRAWVRLGGPAATMVIPTRNYGVRRGRKPL